MTCLFKLPIIFLILFSANLLALTTDESALFTAIKSGDTESIKELILAQVDVNVVDSEGYTPLHRAVIYNKLESVNELLAYAKTDKEARLPESAVIDEWYLYGVTPLILASYLGYTDIAESLIRYKANIKARDSVDGTMPIHIATANGHIEIAKLLILDDKKLVQALDNHNNTPLHWASMSDQPSIVALLIQNGANINAEDISGIKPIDYARSISKNQDIIDLLTNSQNPSEYADTINNSTPKVEIKMGWTDTEDNEPNFTRVNDNKKTNSIIFKIDSVDTKVEALGTAIINPSVNNLELIATVKEGDIIRIKRLLRDGVSPNFTLKNGYTPLHIAIYENKIESIKELLLYEDIEIDIMGNIPEISNWEFGYSTPLFLASALGNDEIVSLLLDNNADISYKNDTTGIMAIHLASYYKHDSIVRILIGKDYSIINAYSSDDRTPLHYAVISGSSELTSTLLGYYDINYDAKDILSKTPLHYAVTTDNLDIVKLLVNENVDQTIKDDEGYTPYLLAIKLGREAIIEFLEDIDKVKWWKIE